MAAINFPTATADGQTFEADNGVVYTYVGTPPNGYWSGTFQNEGYATLDGRYLKLDSSNDPVTASLEVNNNVTISRNSTAPGLVLNNSNYSGDDASIYYFDTGAVVFKSDDTEIFRYDADGNVGIGTNSPDVKLHVYSSDVTQSWSDNAADLIKLEGSVEGINFVTSSTGFLSFSDADARAQGVIEYLHSSDSMQFDTAGSERMRIDSAGNVGIGTISPSQMLHISGTNPQLQFTDTDTNASFNINANSAAGNVAFNVDQNTNSTQSSFIVNTRGSERLRIVGTSGNVGIGTSSPAGQLHVNSNADTSVFITAGTSTTDANLYFGDSDGGFRGLIQYDNSEEALIFHASGILQENFRTLASGGITFNGDTATANALDDYEEGQFTPSLSGATAYTYRNGHYTKIGDMVYFFIRVQASASTTSSSPWQITGLPFQSTNLDCFGGAFRSYGRNVQENQVGDAVDFHIPKSATNVIAKVGAGTANVATNNTNHVILNEQIILNGFYKTNS